MYINDFNYCTFNYSASWWNWERWEQEIDFMALNGINMPLSIVGLEGVWYDPSIYSGGPFGGRHQRRRRRNNTNNRKGQGVYGQNTGNGFTINWRPAGWS